MSSKKRKASQAETPMVVKRAKKPTAAELKEQDRMTRVKKKTLLPLHARETSIQKMKSGRSRTLVNQKYLRDVGQLQAKFRTYSIEDQDAVAAMLVYIAMHGFSTLARNRPVVFPVAIENTDDDLLVTHVYLLHPLFVKITRAFDNKWGSLPEYSQHTIDDKIMALLQPVLHTTSPKGFETNFKPDMLSAMGIKGPCFPSTRAPRTIYAIGLIGFAAILPWAAHHLNERKLRPIEKLRPGDFQKRCIIQHPFPRVKSKSKKLPNAGDYLTVGPFVYTSGRPYRHPLLRREWSTIQKFINTARTQLYGYMGNIPGAVQSDNPVEIGWTLRPTEMTAITDIPTYPEAPIDIGEILLQLNPESKERLFYDPYANPYYLTHLKRGCHKDTQHLYTIIMRWHEYPIPQNVRQPNAAPSISPQPNTPRSIVPQPMLQGFDPENIQGPNAAPSISPQPNAPRSMLQGFDPENIHG